MVVVANACIEGGRNEMRMTIYTMLSVLNFNSKSMFSIATVLAMGAAALIAKQLDKASEYKTPKGKHKNRYK